MAYILKDSFTSVSTGSGLSSTVTKTMMTFTPSESYTLVRIGAWIGISPYPNDTPGGIYSVSGGLPNILLESFTMTVTSFVNPGQETFTLLDSPLALSSGIQYAIVFDYAGSAITTKLYGHRDFVSDPYPGGKWMRFRIGTGWEDIFGSGDMNMYFKTYSEYSLSPTPSHEATGVLLFPTLSWTVD